MRRQCSVKAMNRSMGMVVKCPSCRELTRSLAYVKAYWVKWFSEPSIQHTRLYAHKAARFNHSQGQAKIGLIKKMNAGTCVLASEQLLTRFSWFLENTWKETDAPTSANDALPHSWAKTTRYCSNSCKSSMRSIESRNWTSKTHWPTWLERKKTSSSKESCNPKFLFQWNLLLVIVPEITRQYIHSKLHEGRGTTFDTHVRRLSICANYIEEILRLGHQFEDMYPSLFANLTVQLKLNFVDSDVLSALIGNYSSG